MNDHEKMEFWNSLARLYDETLALRETATVHQEAARNLQTACEALRDVAVAHEKRLDRIEVIQQWLAEKERRREEQEGR
jgi:hypothetical protein